MDTLSVIEVLTCGLTVAWFLCFLVVLVKLFRAEGAIAGIFGLVCGLYTFVWGWIHRKEHGIEGVMVLWTALIVLDAVFQWMYYSMGY